MSSSMVVLSPRADSVEQSRVKFKKQWNGDISGKTLLLYNNGRPNADTILDTLYGDFQRRYGVKRRDVNIAELGKIRAKGLGLDLIDDLVKDIDAVVLAAAD